MSHGSTDKCEPNFTPLLDLVLQLVMFFMLCANFVMEQSDDSIKLPEAVAAKALDKDVRETIFINLNAQGKVLLPPTERREGEDMLENPLQLENYMKSKAAIEKRKTGKETPEATIILRIDEKTQFKDTYPMMQACRKAGYSKVELRAILHNGQYAARCL